MIINRIYETQNLLSYLVSFLVGLRTYQHPCIKSTLLIGVVLTEEFIAYVV